MRSNKGKDNETKTKNAGDAVQTHLQRAKARSQAIAEQYNHHYTTESYNLRQKLTTCGQYGLDRPFTFDGPLPMPEELLMLESNNKSQGST